MTSDLAEAHRAALANTRLIIDAVTADQLHAPTQCDEWDVEELIHHIVYGNWWVSPLVAGETIEQVGDRFEGDLLGDNFAAAYAASSDAAAGAFLAPGAMEKPCAVSYGPVPGSVYCGHRFIDVLVHGWDLAQGTGGNDRLPADLVQLGIKTVVPQLDTLAASGAFGKGADPGEAADPQTRLLALLGRTG
jgi:uncharacterized protein (TIGR03086 family)